MSGPAVERAAEWVYRGVWGGLSRWFRVPGEAPTLPARSGERLLTFHPSRRYLSYLKLYFWVLLLVTDLALLGGWLALTVAAPSLGAALAVPALLLAVVPDIVAYVAIHLRYDTMWYVMSERSLRCRRGIWIIVEHTITFENVQNVGVRQGPLQQLFGISDIVVETAGAAEGEGESKFASGNKAILEGIDNPHELRELILARVRASKGGGLGDEPDDAPRTAWTTEHLDVLREILAAAKVRQR